MSVFGRFHFGPKFRHWTLSLYSSPMAIVKTNTNYSKPFLLSRLSDIPCIVCHSSWAVITIRPEEWKPSQFRRDTRAKGKGEKAKQEQETKTKNHIKRRTSKPSFHISPILNSLTQTKHIHISNPNRLTLSADIIFSCSTGHSVKQYVNIHLSFKNDIWLQKSNISLHI